MWIALFGVLLAGVVFLQGQLRTLNSSVGQSVQEITSLERDNAVLRSQISGLSSDQRIVAQAKRMGFVEPPIGSSRFLAVSPGDSGRAVALMAPAVAGNAYASLDSQSVADPASGQQETTGAGAAAGATVTGPVPSLSPGEASAPTEATTVAATALPDGGSGTSGG